MKDPKFHAICTAYCFTETVQGISVDKTQRSVI